MRLTDITAMFLGSQPVTAVWLGGTKIWPPYPTWELGARYQVGDIVMHDGQLWRSLRAQTAYKSTTPGAYAAVHFWELVT